MDGFKVVKPELIFIQSVVMDPHCNSAQAAFLQDYAVGSKSWDWGLVGEYVHRHRKVSDGSKEEKKKLGFWARGRTSLRSRLYWSWARQVYKLFQRHICSELSLPIALKHELFLKMTPQSILSKQFLNGRFSRRDMIVQYLAIEQFFDKNDYGFAIYEKVPADTGRSLTKLGELIKSIRDKGFDSFRPIKIDAQGRVVD